MNRVTMKCADGIVRSWKATAFRKYLLWKLRGGWFTLRNGRYHIDPGKYETRGFKPIFPYLGLVERYERVLYFHEDHSEPFTLTRPDDTEEPSARSLEAITESSFIRQLLPQPVPWILILLIVGFVVIFGIVGVFVR